MLFAVIFTFLSFTAFPQSGEKWATGGNSINANSFFGTLNNFPINFKTNNVQRMTLTPAGFLGLGTDAPTVMFECSGDGKIFNFKILDNLIVGNSISAKKIFSPNGTVDFDGSNITTTASVTSDHIFFTGPKKHIMSSSGTIDFDGNNLSTSGTIYANNISVSNFTIPFFAGSGKGLITFDNNGTFHKLNFNNDPNTVLFGNGTFGYLPENGWSINGSDMYSLPSGNIGIGTNMPVEKLDINGNANIRGTLYVQNGVIIGQRVYTQKVFTDSLKSVKVVTEKITSDSIVSTNLKTEYVNTKSAKVFNINIDGNNNSIYSTSGSLSFAGNNFSNIATVSSETISSNNLITNNISSTNGVINFNSLTNGVINFGSNNISSSGSAAFNALNCQNLYVGNTIMVNGLITSKIGMVNFDGNNISTTGTITSNNFSSPAFSSSGNGLVSFDNSGNFKKINFNGDTNSVLRGDGTFSVLPDLNSFDTIQTEVIVSPTGTVDFAENNITTSREFIGNAIFLKGAKKHIMSSTGTVDFDGNNILTSGTITSNNFSSPAFSNSGNGLISFDNSGNFKKINFNGDTNSVLFGDGTFGNLPASGWNINGSDMYSSPAGNIGIGTSQPGAKLDVAGSLKASDGTFTSLTVSSNLNVNGSLRVDGIISSKIGNVNFDGNNISTSGTISANNISVSNFTNPVFAGSGNGIILSDNNGTFQKLNFTNDSNSVLFANGTFGNLPATGWNINGSDMYSSPAGNIGIGTSQPVAKLDVAGSLKATDGTFTSLTVSSNLKVYGSLRVDGIISSKIGNVNFDGNNISTTGTITSNNFSSPTFSNSGNGLISFDNSGNFQMLNFDGNHNSYLRGDGTFGSLSGSSSWDTIYANAIIGGYINATKSIQLDGSITAGSRGTGTIGEYSIVVGGPESTLGYPKASVASGKYSVSFGAGNESTNIGSMSFGGGNISSGLFSFAIGANNISSGNLTVAIGSGNTVTGSNTTVTGKGNIADGKQSAIIGGTGNNLTIDAMNSAIIGGEGITATQANSVYVPNLVSTGNVGIGVEIPIEKLDVNGNANIRGFLYVQDGVIIGRRIDGQRVNSDTIDVNKLAIKYATTDSLTSLKLVTEKMAVSRDINIGEQAKIGSNIVIDGITNNITTPGEITAGSITAGTMNVTNVIVDSSVVNSMQVVDELKIGNSSLWLSSVNDPNSNDVENSIYSSNGDLKIQCNVVYPGNTIINAIDGMVGIGTNTLDAKLNVNGTLRFDGINAQPNYVLTATDETGLATWQPQVTYTGINGISVSGYEISNLAPNATHTGDVTGFDVLTIADGAVTSAKLNSMNAINGQVLKFNGTNWAAGDDNNTAFTVGTGTGLNFNGTTLNSVWSVDGDKIFNNTTGYVGIGTTNPLTNFHIKGITNFLQNPNPTNSAIVRIEDDFINNTNPQDNRNAWWDLIASASGSKFIFSTGTGNTTNDVMTLLENGRVGIGTISPDYNFEISHNNLAGSSFALTNTASNSFKNQIIFKWRTIEKWSLGIDHDANEQNAFYIAGGTTQSTKFLINENGMVGIGVDNPYTKLTISGNNEDLIHINQTDDAISAKIAFSIGSYNSAIPIAARIGTEVKGENGLIFETNFNNILSEKMRISDKGNVGINTSMPTQKLEINDGNLLITNNSASIFSSGSKLFFGGLHNGNKTKTYFFQPDPSNNDADVIFAELKIESAIGSAFTTKVFFTAQDGKASYVKGKFVAGEIEVKDIAGTFPDYVFAPDYKLRTLEETENFINQNCHLPEVPSAKEIEDNGMNIGNMSITLLKKVEELMLYSIEQNKRIKELERQLEDLKNKQ